MPLLLLVEYRYLPVAAETSWKLSAPLTTFQPNRSFSDVVSVLPLTVPVMALAAALASPLLGSTQVLSPLVMVMATVSSAVISASSTFVHVPASGSAANTDTGSRETSMTSDSSADRSLVRTGVFIKLLPPLISPGASAPQVLLFYHTPVPVSSFIYRFNTNFANMCTKYGRMHKGK